LSSKTSFLLNFIFSLDYVDAACNAAHSAAATGANTSGLTVDGLGLWLRRRSRLEVAASLKAGISWNAVGLLVSGRHRKSERKKERTADMIGY